MKQKIGKFYLNNSNKRSKKLKNEEWIKVIKRVLLIHYRNVHI